MSPAVENLVSRLHARPSGKEWLAKCPAHNDREPSLSINEGSDGRALLKCFAGCDTKDVLAALGMTWRDLFPAKYFQPSGNGATSAPKPTLPLDWERCVDEFTDKHLDQLAKSRGYSREFCQWLKDNKLVGIHEGCIAFPVHDHNNVVAVHCRSQDGKWRYFPIGTKVHPLVIGESLSGDTVHVFESQWDAFAFMDVSGERSGIIVTRGASSGAVAVGVIPQRAITYVWAQNDEPGEKLATDICAQTKATVKRVKIPAPHKDLNDWTRSGASCKDLLDAIVNAEIVREAEKSWTDAVDEAVITSSELHSLTLKPRQKLLGDWFCEGDLGFIFAFRGVGKTWFALGIAQALSRGGKLGDWQAPAPVKVLYIDGEMPPDLMRDRCDGLQSSNDQLEFLNHEILFERSGKVLNITNRDVQQAITQRCIVSGIKVLILDNLSTLACGMKENEADSWELVNNWLLNLRRRRIAVVIVHHAGRSGEMRGTTKREDNVFWIIALDDMKKIADDQRGARFVSRFTKRSRNTQEELPAYEWHFVTEANGEVSITHKAADALDVFRQIIADGVTDCTQIAQEMHVSPATVSRFAKKGIDAGWLKKRGRNYEVIPTGKEAEK
jgi:hypothetical protein